MKILVLSDFHLEFCPWEEDLWLDPNPNADVVVLAGDFATQKQEHLDKLVQLLSNVTVPIVYVMGNHDFYYNSLSRGRDKFKDMLQKQDDFECYVLENEFVIIGDTVFYGTPLWTDFELPGYLTPPGIIAKNVSDFYSITHKRKPIGFPRYVQKFQESVQFLREHLTGPRNTKRVVVTHWAPNMKSIGPQFQGNPLNPYFVNQLPEGLVSGADVWVHGHTHGTSDYMVGNCRIVANPRGYPRRNGFENFDFDPHLVIEV